MANLTITVDEHVLERARIRALRMKTSVNAVLCGYLESFAQATDEQARAVDGLLAISDEINTPAARAAGKLRGKRRWRRDDLHER